MNVICFILEHVLSSPIHCAVQLSEAEVAVVVAAVTVHRMKQSIKYLHPAEISAYL